MNLGKIDGKWSTEDRDASLVVCATLCSWFSKWEIRTTKIASFIRREEAEIGKINSLGDIVLPSPRSTYLFFSLTSLHTVTNDSTHRVSHTSPLCLPCCIRWPVMISRLKASRSQSHRLLHVRFSRQRNQVLDDESQIQMKDLSSPLKANEKSMKINRLTVRPVETLIDQWR